MNFKIQKKIGRTSFMFEDNAESHLDFFQKVSFYNELPEKCECGSDNITLVFREPKGYKYASIKCHECLKELQYGQKKQPEGELFQKQWVQPQAQGEA